MARLAPLDLLGRIVAFLFAGAAASFGVAVLVDWIAQLLGTRAGTLAIVVAVAVVLALLFWRIFLQIPVSEEAPCDEEQS